MAAKDRKHRRMKKFVFKMLKGTSGKLISYETDPPLSCATGQTAKATGNLFAACF
jgi:hypothetical protein